MTEFDPRYHVPRRSVSKELAVGAALVSVALFLYRQCAAQERVYEAELERARTQDSLDMAYRALEAAERQPAPLAANGPPEPPVEFEVTWGDARVEVTSARLAIGGRTLELVRPPRWRWSSPRLSLTYDNAVRVAATSDGAMLATAHAWALVREGPAPDSLDEVVENLVTANVASVGVTTSTEISGTIAGLPARGVRWAGPKIAFEALAAITPSGKLVTARFSSTGAAGDLRDLRAVIAEAALKDLPPLPTFEATVRDAAGDVLEEASVYLDRPITLAGQPLVLRRRATIRAKVEGVFFERDPSMLIVERDAELGMVTLRADDIAVILSVSEREVALADLLRDPSVTDPGPIKRRFGDETYTGLTASMGGALVIEVYGFKRDGRHVIVTTQYHPSRAKEAVRLMTPLFTSAR